jgi:oxygen-independent coproporphyrinogen-3 oxidase
MRRLAVYIHIPFCIRKCLYCDFNSYALSGLIVDEFVEAVIKEIADCPYQNSVVPSIFFGGGTPTVLSGEQLARILQAINNNFTVENEVEITAEANPGTVDLSKLQSMRKAGFNRLSFGVQSFDDEELRRIGRIHSSQEAVEAVELARSAGFDNLNLDLIFGLPEQTLSLWESNIKQAIDLSPEHLALYDLILEPNTAFYKRSKRGTIKLPAEDDEMAMFEASMVMAPQAGFEQYEVSNYAKPGFQCRHNLIYWHNQEYIGFGPGAVSYVDNIRWKNLKHPRHYIDRIASGQSLVGTKESLSRMESLGETIMLGLRLASGIQVSELESRYDLPVRKIIEPVIGKEVHRGHLEYDGNNLRLTHSGLLFANDVTNEFLAIIQL